MTRAAPPASFVRLRSVTLLAVILFCLMVGSSWQHLHGNQQQANFPPARVVHFNSKYDVMANSELPTEVLPDLAGGYHDNRTEREGQVPPQNHVIELIKEGKARLSVDTTLPHLTLDWGKQLSRRAIDWGLERLEGVVRGSIPELWDEVKGQGRKVKIALVKQDVYTDLYCAEQNAPVRQTVLSTLKHLGPVGLFDWKRFNTTFLVMETNRNEGIWREKVKDCRLAPSYDKLYETRWNYTVMMGRPLSCQAALLVTPEQSVDWDEFDVVIALDMAVSKETIAKHPRVVWAYYVTSTCMSSWERSLAAPLGGYDLFLSGDFGMRRTLSLPPHVVEFPYTFASFDSLEPMLQLHRSSEVPPRSGVLLSRGTHFEDNEAIYLTSELNMTISSTHGTPQQLYKTLSSTKYYVFLGPRKNLTGNAMAEALAGGAVIIGCCTRNVDVLLLSGTYATTFARVFRLIQKMENDRILYDYTRDLQSRLFSFLAFDRPLFHLLHKGAQLLKNGRQPT